MIGSLHAQFAGNKLTEAISGRWSGTISQIMNR